MKSKPQVMALGISELSGYAPKLQLLTVPPLLPHSPALGSFSKLGHTLAFPNIACHSSDPFGPARGTTAGAGDSQARGTRKGKSELSSDRDRKKGPPILQRVQARKPTLENPSAPPKALPNLGASPFRCLPLPPPPCDP
jgi:hypothetical protein